MATSGEDEGFSIVNTYCTKPDEQLFGFHLACSWAGDADVYTWADGHAQWTCDHCGYLNETTCRELDIE